MKRKDLLRRLWWNFVVGLGVVWIVIETVPGIALGGTVGHHVAIVVAIVVLQLALATLAERLVSADERGLSERHPGVGCLGLITSFVVLMLCGPISWYLVSRLAELLDVPFTVTGFLPYFIAPLLAFVLSVLPLRVIGAFANRRMREQVLGNILRAMASIAGFALMLTVGAFRIDGDTWWHTAIAVVTLVMPHHLVDWSFSINIDGELRTELLRKAPAVALLAFGSNALMLWLTAWLSPYVSLRLRIDGLAGLFFGALVCLVLNWAVNFVFMLRGLNRLLYGQAEYIDNGVLAQGDLRAVRYGYTVKWRFYERRNPSYTRGAAPLREW